ncbi:MAG: hypothetical protein Q9213_002270 [Squamulea squamosa]
MSLWIGHNGHNFRLLNAPTDSVYLDLAEAEGFQPISIPLPLNAKAHWIGSPSAEEVLLFFHGAALISPWGSFDTSAPSFERNGYNDSVNAPILQKWSAYFMNGAEADDYNQPFHTSDFWWKGLDGVVQQMLITAGTDEVLLDVVAAFAKRIEVRIYNGFGFRDVRMLTLYAL